MELLGTSLMSPGIQVSRYVLLNNKKIQEPCNVKKGQQEKYVLDLSNPYA